MLQKRILIGAAAVALALTPVAAADAKRGKGFKPPKGPFLSVNGSVARTSVVRSRCPIASALRATSIETTTTTYRYTFSGRSPKGRDLGSVRNKGESTYQYVREVEGESEYVKPESLGPVTRPLGEQESTFGSAVRRARGARGALDIDFNSLAGGLRHTMTVPVPKKGAPITHLINPDPVTRRDPRPAPGCTHTELITVTGTITVSQI
jgi:hypothetical protein